MVGRSSTSLLTILIFVAYINGGSQLVHAISCQNAITRMLPCQAFLMGLGEITIPCCQSAQILSQIARTMPEERTSICQCLKQAAIVIGINVNRAQQIPKLCHIDHATGFVDPNVDCNKLNALAPTISPSPMEEEMMN
ncbi:hypothetical protein LXL04_027022 [Taraxacum kok-saghyz]